MGLADPGGCVGVPCTLRNPKATGTNRGCLRCFETQRMAETRALGRGGGGGRPGMSPTHEASGFKGGDRINSSQTLLLHPNGPMHNLSSALLALSNHLLSGKKGMRMESFFLFELLFVVFIPKVLPK